MGPLSAKNDAMIKPQPSVKQIANFWGTSTMTGRNRANEVKTKNTPVARNKPKYIRAFPEGMLLVADWKFPLTPLETLDRHQKKKYKIYHLLQNFPFN